MNRPTLLIAAREYSERVKKRSFILVTLLVPLFMVACMVLPTLLFMYAGGETKQVPVIDYSGVVAPQLESGPQVEFRACRMTEAEAREQLTDDFGLLVIGRDITANPDNVKLYLNDAGSVHVEDEIASQISRIIEDEKLKAEGAEGVRETLRRVKTEVSVQTFKNTPDNTADQTSSTAATAFAFALAFILDMLIMTYGGMIMTSVIEEKNNRVLEVMVSSVRPFDIMMGKIVGVAAVAVTQIVIWAAAITVVATAVLPQMLTPDLAASAAASAAQDGDSAMLQALTTLTDTGYILAIVGQALLFLIGGFMLYGSMCAAVGSAVDNAQDASQLQMPILIPTMVALFAMMAIINDAGSPLAIALSLFPFTSPIIMMARLPFGVPLWQVALSLVLLYASFIVMVWISAKIYRIGIFMYGKKPTFRDLYRWMRYK